MNRSEGYGSEAARHFDAALTTVKRLSREWGIETEDPLPGASYSLVLAAGEFVLRVPMPKRERGIEILRAFEGHGGVSVLRADEASGAVLLPRLRPGKPLDTLPEDEATEAWIVLARRLRNARGSARSAEEQLAPLWAKRTDLGLATDVQALARRLVETSPAPCLLHGDLHHYNVLRHGEEWVAIDPEGILGDPAYEAAASLRNPVPALGREPDLPGLLHRRVRRLAEGLEAPAERIWGWALVRTALCLWDDQGAFEGAVLKAVRALDALRGEFRV